MSVYFGQCQVAGTVNVFTLPPGPYNATVYNLNSTVYLAVGTSPTTPPVISSTVGLVMHSIPTSFSGYQGSRGGVVWALNTAATTVAINYILSTQET